MRFNYLTQGYQGLHVKKAKQVICLCISNERTQQSCVNLNLLSLTRYQQTTISINHYVQNDLPTESQGPKDCEDNETRYKCNLPQVVTSKLLHEKVHLKCQFGKNDQFCLTLIHVMHLSVISTIYCKIMLLINLYHSML